MSQTKKWSHPSYFQNESVGTYQTYDPKISLPTKPFFKTDLQITQFSSLSISKQTRDAILFYSKGFTLWGDQMILQGDPCYSYREELVCSIWKVIYATRYNSTWKCFQNFKKTFNKAGSLIERKNKSKYAVAAITSSIVF